MQPQMHKGRVTSNHSNIVPKLFQHMRIIIKSYASGKYPVLVVKWVRLVQQDRLVTLGVRKRALECPLDASLKANYYDSVKVPL